MAVNSGADLVVVWGGDGTVNEVGSALVGSTTALGLVPAGSGNGLAASLGVPREPVAALDRIFSTPPRAVDVGFLADRPFFNVAGIGLDAHIADLFNLRARGRRGKWPYVMIGVREGCRYKAQEYDVELDGAHRRVSALLIAFANGREYGMGACISPGAELDDGLLEATIVEDRSGTRAIRGCASSGVEVDRPCAARRGQSGSIGDGGQREPASISPRRGTRVGIRQRRDSHPTRRAPGEGLADE